MSNVAVLLLDHLNNLSSDDFKTFLMMLSSTGAQGYQAIGRKKLEGAKPTDVVQLMEAQYGLSEAVQITVKILNEIKQYTLAAGLESKLDGAASASSAPTGGQKVDNMSVSPAPLVSQVITAEGGGIVKAPVFAGGTFTGPITFN